MKGRFICQEVLRRQCGGRSTAQQPLLRHFSTLISSSSPRSRIAISPRLFTRHTSPLPQTGRAGNKSTTPGQRRYASEWTKSTMDAVRALIKDSPIMGPLGLFVAISSVFGFAYALYIVLDTYQKFSMYPEDVGMKLKRGLWFTDQKPDTAQAYKAYIEALELAKERGMDSLCDEVIGIRTTIARMFEQAGQYHNAIEVLESQREACLLWLQKYGDHPDGVVRRSKMLRWSVRISTKLAELYSDRYVGDREKTEENLVWAVETSLKEFRRRAEEGVKEGEGEWLTEDETGTQLEDLGHEFEKKDNHYFAAQLFLRALMLKSPPDCHSVVLMNNLAASIAQQLPYPEPGVPPPSREQLRENGRVWLKQARALADSIKAPVRTTECDTGCVAAIHNLGEFAEMDGNIAEARDKYEEAGSIAHAVGFEEGLIHSREGLRRLDRLDKRGRK